MAKKKTMGSLSSKIKGSVNKHKGDPIDYGRMDLPPGINNGIAQLTKCYFAKYKSGKYEGQDYFRAEGTVVEPKEVNGIPVFGQTTSIMEPVCDTTNRNGDVTTTDEHVARVLNHLRLLGLDTEEMDDDDIEGTVKALEETAPYFRFATSERNGGGAWENWRGCQGLEEYAPDDDDGVEDDSEDEEEEEEEEEEVRPTPKKKVVKKKPAVKKEPTLEELGELADIGDEDSQTTIAAKCEEEGLDANDYETWVEAVTALQTEEGVGEPDDDAEYEEVEDEEEGGEAEEEETPTPDKEELYFYKPPKKRKKVEVEVTAVFKTKETCNLKDLENEGATYKGVPWKELSYDAE